MAPPFPSPIRPRAVVALGLLALLALGGVWLWGRARSSTPVSAESALSAFRADAPAAPPRGDGVPAPGVYTYRVSGAERGGIGPLALRRALPAAARYVVTPAAGGFLESLSLSEEHIEVTRYRATSAGLRATWRRTDVTFVGVGRDDRRSLSPSPLHMPARLRVGQAWTARYRAGGLGVVTTSRVLRAEPVSVAGRRVPTFVVRSDSVTSGAHPGTRVETRWWAPSLAMPVRWTIDMDIGGAVTFQSRATLELESAVART